MCMRDRYMSFRILLFLQTIISPGVEGILKCSQCESSAGGSCVLRAPTPTPCRQLDASNGGPVNCMIATHLNSNGTTISFVRGCTVARVASGCMPQGSGSRLCYQTCSSDGCNTDRALRPDIHPTCLLVFLIISFVFKCT
ncbi:omega-scoloptoxin(05)-Ssm1a-like [Dreissena polymorpha]|uniref:Uncharacterized protein n=1 Tax=Dreissena polymorpha TaxID=45954 RepID=A0A9D4LPP4_DREPO|nr:omega-scoloptoxin(05)-Ssm1a-like [Dreissena polymorpha]KAH3862685.1 hypothetical protein DPMN_025658 [Dreissena polymorpha]